MKRLMILCALLPACLDNTTIADDQLGEAEQDVHTVSGCNATFDLRNSTATESYGFSAARYTNYNCSSIQIDVITGDNYYWHANLAWTGLYADWDEGYCTHALLTAAFKRTTIGAEGDYGTNLDAGAWVQSGSYNGTGFPIYECDEPAISRNFGKNQSYRINVISQGRDPNDPYQYTYSDATSHWTYEPFRIDLVPF